MDNNLTPEQTIREKHEAKGLSKERGIASALGAGMVFGGPVGALVGLGVYALSRKMERGELDAALAEHDYRVQQGAALAQPLVEQFASTVSIFGPLFEGRYSNDTDRAGFKQAQAKFERAQKYATSGDPEIQALGVKLMQEVIDVDLPGLRSNLDARADKLDDNDYVEQIKFKDRQHELATKIAEENRAHQTWLRQKAVTQRDALELQERNHQQQFKMKSLGDLLTRSADVQAGWSGRDLEAKQMMNVVNNAPGSPQAKAAMIGFLQLPSVVSHTERLLKALGGLVGGAAGATGGGLIGAGAGATAGALTGGEIGKALSALDYNTLADMVQDAIDTGDTHARETLTGLQTTMEALAEDAGIDKKFVTGGLQFDRKTNASAEWRKIERAGTGSGGGDQKETMKFRPPPFSQNKGDAVDAREFFNSSFNANRPVN